MSWFTRRLVIDCPGLSELAAAIRYAADVEAGRVPPIAEVTSSAEVKRDPDLLAFVEWLDARDFPAVKRADWIGMFKNLTARQPSTPEQRARARKVLGNSDAPLPTGSTT